MKANYGYLDGSGQYFITIDTDKCAACREHFCVEACPKGLFFIFTDDYDDQSAGIREEFRKKIKYECAECKPAGSRPPFPCVVACVPGAIEHSW